MRINLTIRTLGQAIQDGSIRFKPWLTKFSPEIFEVDFSNVVNGRGSELYHEADKFFENTYLTQRMCDVVSQCLARTAGLNNRGTVYLATGFGGGKSHLLTLIYHIFNERKVPDPMLLSDLSISHVSDAKVVAIDGHNLTFPLSGNDKLSPYLKSTKEETVKALEAEGKPLVFLIDELVVYLAKITENQKRQEMANFHTLLSSVNATRNCVILVSNPKGAGVYGQDTETLDALIHQTRLSTITEETSSLLGRVSQPIVPVQKEDFVSILRKRLIDYIDPTLKTEAENYLGRKISSVNFKDHYPFHPCLIDVLYNRVSLFVDFQKTRDALKVIALVIKGIVQNPTKVDFHVISPSDFLFSESNLRDMLTNEKVFGSDLEQAVTEDVITAAQSVDKSIFGRFGRIASTVYLYSLHPEPSKRGVSVEELFQCMTTEHSKDDLEQYIHNFYSNESTFMWLEGGKYLFKSRQNVPNMIKTRSNQVLRKEIQKYVETTLFRTVFTKTSDSYCAFYRVDDYNPISNSLNVAVPLYYEDIEKTTRTVLSINARKKHSAIVLVPDTKQQGTVEYYSKYVLGAERVKKEVRGDKALLAEAKKLGEQYEANNLQAFKGMYTNIKFLQGTAVRETPLHPMSGSTIKEALVKRLRDIQKVTDVQHINPKNYLNPLLGTRKKVQVRDLYENVESMASIPYASRNEVRKIISQGVYEGHIGLLRGALPENDELTGKEKFHIREVEAINVNDGDTVLTADYTQHIAELLENMTKDDDTSLPSPNDNDEDDEHHPPLPSTEEYEAETFVCDAGALHGTLNSKLTELLLSGSDARATVVFSGNINGTLTAKDVGEIRSIVDLADGLSKASNLLGGVKVSSTIYRKVNK
jgi:hypothetical protein